jgi:hypothetical protein
MVLTDLHGTQLGDITNALNTSIVLPLNRLPTASFQIPIQHKLAKYFADPTWDGIVKAYRNGVLRFCGPVVSSAEAFDASNGQTIAVNAAGPFWRLAFRLLGTNAAGWSLGNASTTYDLGYIAGQMLAAANAQGYTGIETGTLNPSENGSAGVFWFQPVDTAIAQMSTGLNSFDFEVAPTEPTNTGQAFPRLGLFNTYNVMGSVKNNAIFEFGTTKANVTSYGRQIDRSQLCNFGWIEQPAVSDYSGILTSQDAASQAARGVYMALIDNGGVEWDVLRQALADANVAIRKQARQVVTFTPKPNATPSPLDDYIVGDQVRARIVVNGVSWLDAMMRVWGITFALDNQGNETPTLELIHP